MHFANLLNADLTGAILDRAITKGTTLPEGFKPPG